MLELALGRYSGAREHPLEGQQRTFKKGEPIWSAGQDPDLVWTLTSGHANISIADAQGNRTIVQVCGLGQNLCPAAAILGRPFPCSATASEDMAASAVPRARFMKVMGVLQPLAQGPMRQMASDLCQSHVQVSQAPTSARNRLARLLERLHRQFLGAVLPFGRQELAEMSGTRTETVSRTLAPWEKEGIIQSEINSLRVLHSEKLEEVQD